MASEVTPFGGRRFYMDDYEKTAAQQAAMRLQDDLAGNRMAEELAARERMQNAALAAQMQMGGTFTDKTAAQQALLATQNRYASESQQAGFGHQKELVGMQQAGAKELAAMSPAYMAEQRTQEEWANDAALRAAQRRIKENTLSQFGPAMGGGEGGIGLGMTLPPELMQAAALGMISPGMSQIMVGEYGQRRQEEQVEKKKTDAVQSIRDLAAVNLIAAREAVRSNPDLLEKSLKDPELSTMLALSPTEAGQLADAKFGQEFSQLVTDSVSFMQKDDAMIGADPNETETDALNKRWLDMYSKMLDSGIPPQVAKQKLWDYFIRAFNTDVDGLGDKDMTEKLKAKFYEGMKSINAW